MRLPHDQTVVRVPLDALHSETISVLTGYFQDLFMTCYGEEKQRRQLTAARFSEALARTEILPLVAENHEDYQPE
ncbi:hypothetical protein [Parafrankia sp. FMc2]|uniref:hypothetical protein n=1 Tax=Parafrankia sp. FMc2 TaxID=3233196 RepID=UPI0034D4E4DE